MDPLRPPGLQLRRHHWLEVLAHAWDGAPDEACGLLIGRGNRVETFVPCRNADRSSRTFSIGPDGWRAADEAVDAGDGLAVIGVVHSHTHTEAYPSPTDVAQAPDPGWHYVIVSLRAEEPTLRSFRIVDGEIDEEPVDLRD